MIKWLRSSGILITLLLLVCGTGGKSFRVWADNSIAVQGYVDVRHKGKVVRIVQNLDSEQDFSYPLSGFERQCPPFCLQPYRLAENIETVSEFEVLACLAQKQQSAQGLLIDVRAKNTQARETIPGSIAIPFTQFIGIKTEAEKVSLMQHLGVMNLHKGSDIQPSWDFLSAPELILWCEDARCDQAGKAITALVQYGYLTAKMKYYRGGLQAWKLLGLTVVKD